MADGENALAPAPSGISELYELAARQFDRLECQISRAEGASVRLQQQLEVGVQLLHVIDQQIARLQAGPHDAAGAPWIGGQPHSLAADQVRHGTDIGLQACRPEDSAHMHAMTAAREAVLAMVGGQEVVKDVSAERRDGGEVQALRSSREQA